MLSVALSFAMLAVAPRTHHTELFGLGPIDGVSNRTDEMHAYDASAKHWNPWRGTLGGEEFTFYSWLEEDRDLLQQFPEWASQPGTYLEMGACDGYNLSNTMMFYESLGWRGVLIEPQPACQAQMHARQPGDPGYRSPVRNTIFSNATCASFQTLDMEVTDSCDAGVGGSEFVSDEWRAENRNRTRTQQINCSPVGHMLSVANVTRLDFWSLDVEGAELDALRGMDWNIPVHALLVEMLPVNNPRGEAGLEEIRSYLHGLGFERRGRGPVGTLGWDELWVNPRFPPRSAAESM